MYKELYSRFLSAQKENFHMACHSHHYWPDVTREAQLKYWDDSAQFVDAKWGHIFGEVLPKLQKQISKIINTTKPQQIVFAPNTHELVYRLLSGLHGDVKVLTTDSEFYSFERQISRIEEHRSPHWQITRVSQFPIETFERRFAEAIESEKWDVIFLSQVFFNSGFAPSWKNLVDKSAPSSIFVIDGYHGFMALPTDLKEYEDRIYYVAGAYKYAQAGEGCCFMHIPQNSVKPEYTGWFAEFGNLSNKQQGVAFADDGYKYAGSTMDFSAAYRMLAVLELFESKKISVLKIHEHIQNCQKEFLKVLDQSQNTVLGTTNLIFSCWEQQGHFLTFQMQNAEQTEKIVADLKQRKIWVDSRKDRLRFGFGLYHSPQDYHQLDLRF